VSKKGFDHPDQRLVDRSRQALDQSLEDLDAATISRLNRIRHTALAETRARRWQWWIPAGGLATACAFLVAVNLSPRAPSRPTQVESPLGDLELLASKENLEMLEELEFYAWLETELDG
jgi:hypothetical protein